MTVQPPVDDADVPRYWRELGLPGLIDTHVHFLPERVQAKVWQYFAEGEKHYGVALAARLRPARGRAGRDPRPARRAGLPDAAVSAQGRHGRLAQRLVGGVRAAAGRRCCSRPRSTPSRRRPSTSPRRSSAGPGSSRCTSRWARFDPRHELLDAVWGRLEETGTPVVIHCGSGPLKGEHTGPRAGHRPAGALPAAAARDRPPRHARVPRLPRAGRALRAGAPGHDDVRHRLHRAAHALRPLRLPTASGT